MLTGWGSAVYSAKVQPGDTVLVVGIGGVGINAVQGAHFAGAQYVIAVDPLENKRQKAAELGATHIAATGEEAFEIVQSLTRGVGADAAILIPGVMQAGIVENAFNAVRKAGTVVLTGMGGMADITVQLPGTMMTQFNKVVRGSLYGECNPNRDIPKLLGLYTSGQLKLDELITRTYALEDVQRGYDDMLAGRNIRGVVVHAT